MLDRHPDSELLERFLSGDLAEEGSRALQRHLFLCAACEERLIGLLPEPATDSSDGVEKDGDLVQRLFEAHGTEISCRCRQLASERAAAAALWREIEPFEPARRRSLVAGNFRFQSWGFFELLLERSCQAVLEDARESEDLLRLALDVAEQLDPGEHGPQAVAAAKARAWIHLGNTLRVLSEFRLSETAFQTAEIHLSRSWLDPLDEAVLLEFRAALRRAQRRFGEALELIEAAIAICRQVNEPHLQGRSWMVKGLTLRYRGDLAAAASCFRSALALLEEPRLLALCEGNLIGCLQDAGNSAEAAALIPAARLRMEAAGKRTDRLRLRWTEGKIAASLGSPAEAETAFLEVRQAFLGDSLGFDAALISLDLATLYLQAGRLEETKRVAEQILPVFQSREVYREAAAALIVFQRAAEMEQLTLALVDEVGAFLQQARNDPHLRFRAET